jgi:hypothetical protein
MNLYIPFSIFPQRVFKTFIIAQKQYMLVSLFFNEIALLNELILYPSTLWSLESRDYGPESLESRDYGPENLGLCSGLVWSSVSLSRPPCTHLRIIEAELGEFLMESGVSKISMLM